MGSGLAFCLPHRATMLHGDSGCQATLWRPFRALSGSDVDHARVGGKRQDLTPARTPARGRPRRAARPRLCGAGRVVLMEDRYPDGCVRSQSRNALFTRVCQPGPPARKAASTS